MGDRTSGNVGFGVDLAYSVVHGLGSLELGTFRLRGAELRLWRASGLGHEEQPT